MLFKELKLFSNQFQGGYHCRNIHNTFFCRNDKLTDCAPEPQQDLNSVPVRPIDRYILFWGGKYKKLADIPPRVSRSSLAKAQSVCRIKICNYFMIGTLITCFFVTMSGKKDAAAGLVLSERGRQEHEVHKKQFEEKENRQI